MNIEKIIAELEGQRDRLDKAIAALREGKSGSGWTGARKITNPRGHMSPATRKRIGQAMKKRWAERKKRETA